MLDFFFVGGGGGGGGGAGSSKGVVAWHLHYSDNCTDLMCTWLLFFVSFQFY